MDRRFGEARFTSSMIEDRAEGYVGYELTRIQHGKNRQVARVVFWDASGQFFLETFGTDVPLAIIEELIAEAKVQIKVG